ncbi:MAG: hypothetical protein K5886_01715 [Lachnospiraceae bacterium]|nr:hypothetical protein [Lachnospiraceae bacterium]
MTASELISSFMISLALTLIIEEMTALFFGARMKHEFIIIALANTLTNPAMVLYYILISRCFPSVPPVLLQLPGEIVTVFVEAYVYHYMGVTEKYRFSHPFGLAFTANLISWMSGIILKTGGIL